MKASRTRRPTVAVIGDGNLLPDDPRQELAEQAGRAIVDAGYYLVCGGRGGVMEAACRGARSAPGWSEGRIIGILPGSDPNEANPYVDIVIATGLGNARNVIVAHAEAVLMIGGGAGTLSEAAMAAKLGRPVIALRVGGWSGRLADEPSIASGADSVEEAMSLLGLAIGTAR